MNLVTIEDAADDRSVTSQTIRNYIRRGQLTAYRPGHRRDHLVDLDEVRKVVTRSRYGTFGPRARIVPIASNLDLRAGDPA